jgi:hypothetical protein
MNVNVNVNVGVISTSCLGEIVMYDDTVAVFCIIAIILIYFMFFTRRTVLRVFGWAVVSFIIAGIFLIAISSNNGATGMEATRIINDLRALRGATIMFHEEFKTWPLPGQEASLDAYCDRPMTLTERPIYAKVMLAAGSGDVNGPREFYVGVELIPEKNGMTGIQQKLARNARNTGLLQRPISRDYYISGLSVYMQVRIP